MSISKGILPPGGGESWVWRHLKLCALAAPDPKTPFPPSASVHQELPVVKGCEAGVPCAAGGKEVQ